MTMLGKHHTEETKRKLSDHLFNLAACTIKISILTSLPIWFTVATFGILPSAKQIFGFIMLNITLGNIYYLYRKNKGEG